MKVIVLFALVFFLNNVAAAWTTAHVDRGYDFGLTYKGEITSVFSGGVNPHSAYLENLDLRLRLDLEKIAGARGSSIFIYGLGNRGSTDTNSPSAHVGDLQGTSNIQTSSSQIILYEAWFQQLLFADQFSVLFGLHDLNSEFYSLDSAAIFFNASFGIGKDMSQTGVNGPSIFPVTSVALRLKATPSEHFYFETGLFNAQSGDKKASQETHIRAFGDDGTLSVTEAGLLNLTGRSSKYAIGVWSYDRTFPHQEDPNLQVASHGYYVMTDIEFAERISFFLKYGRASTGSNSVGSGLVSGFYFRNIFSEKWKDQLGLGLAKVYLAHEYIRSQEAAGVPMTDSETAIEITYRFEISPEVSLHPDFQYVVNPSGRRDLTDAQVGVLRLEISL